MYTSGDCLVPGIDPSVLFRKIQDEKLIDPVIIGGIAATLFCSEKPEKCEAVINLDGGDYSRFPRQAWPARRSLPFLKFHSTPNFSRNSFPEKEIGPFQYVVNFDGQGGEVLHESFTDVGLFKGISAQEIPLKTLRERTVQAVLSFLEKVKKPEASSPAKFLTAHP